MEDLKKSIELAGCIQPIVVRPLGNGKYELVMCKKKLAALKELGYSKKPGVGGG